MRQAWIAAAVLAADIWAKRAAARLTAPVTLIPGVVGLRYAQNTGMAFSLFSGQPWVLGVVSLIIIAGGWLLLRRYRLGVWSRTAAMLMLGGALGNMIDRFFTGYVVDMIEILAFRFAIFNVADAALTVGCLVMALSILRKPEEWREKRGEADGNEA